MKTLRYRKSLDVKPRLRRNGEAAFYVPRSKTIKEFALLTKFVCHRKLFGLAYWQLQPDYFDVMPPNSGVLLKPIATTNKIFAGISRPGDIDLLVLPYEGAELVLERTLAIEIKIVRARFANQGKSPNDFGYSQASSLLRLGFPYVAVAHLIISDSSPPESWELVHAAHVLDSEGRMGEFLEVPYDTMPTRLIDRSIGRLKKNSPKPELGLLAAYLDSDWSSREVTQNRTVHPSGHRASLNPDVSIHTLEKIEDYYRANVNSFFDTPRFDP